MIRRLLVPLDGSSAAEAALGHGVAIAASFDAELVLLRVVEGRAALTDPMASSVDWRLQRVEAEAYLRKTSGRLATEGLGAVTEVVEGKPADEIVQFVWNRGVDVVVLAAHGLGGAREFPFGGTVHKVLSSAPASVMIVRPAAEGAPVLAKVGYRRVLVPVDGSPTGEWALCLAASIARKHGAELLVLQVVPEVELTWEWLPRSTEETELLDRLRVLQRDRGARYLEDLESRLPHDDLRVRCRVVSGGEVARGVERVAGEEGADLISLSAHGAAEAVPGIRLAADGGRPDPGRGLGRCARVRGPRLPAGGGAVARPVAPLAPGGDLDEPPRPPAPAGARRRRPARAAADRPPHLALLRGAGGARRPLAAARSLPGGAGRPGGPEDVADQRGHVPPRHPGRVRPGLSRAPGAGGAGVGDPRQPARPPPASGPLAQLVRHEAPRAPRAALRLDRGQWQSDRRPPGAGPRPARDRRRALPRSPARGGAGGYRGGAPPDRRRRSGPPHDGRPAAGGPFSRPGVGRDRGRAPGRRRQAAGGRAEGPGGGGGTSGRAGRGRRLLPGATVPDGRRGTGAPRSPWTIRSVASPARPGRRSTRCSPWGASSSWRRARPRRSPSSPPRASRRRRSCAPSRPCPRPAGSSGPSTTPVSAATPSCARSGSRLRRSPSSPSCSPSCWRPGRGSGRASRKPDLSSRSSGPAGSPGTCRSCSSG